VLVPVYPSWGFSYSMKSVSLAVPQGNIARVLTVALVLVFLLILTSAIFWVFNE
jgi:hypothetical protein